MMKLAEKIKNQHVENGHFALFFTGQTGYILKTTGGTLIGIDLYLSDSCRRLVGEHFKRLIPNVLEPDELYIDAVICTHEHADHLDADALPVIWKSGCGGIYANAESIELLKKLGISGEKVKLIERGKTYTEGDAAVKAVFCDHGTSAPNAVGLIITVSGKSMYITGDTSFCPDKLLPELDRQIDIMSVPINGDCGNTNEDEAVKLCGMIRPRIITPSHYGMFAGQGGSPQKFCRLLKENMPEQKYLIMCPGECVII